MNWSLAELRRRLKANPQLALEYPYDAVSATESDAKGKSGVPQSTDQAETLYALLRVHAPDLYPLFIREYSFDRWRIDLAVPSALLAIEINGGRWLPGGGKHGTEADRRKIRKLTLAGWRVLEYSTEMLANDPIGIIEEIREALS